MTFNYAATAATATRLIARFGQTVTIRVYGVGVYNDDDGTNTVPFTDSTRKGVLLDFPDGQKLGPGGLIQESDKQLLLEPGSSAPELQHHAIVDGVEYVIKGISAVNPAGTPALYTLHLTT